MIALSDYLIVGAILFSLSVAGIFINRQGREAHGIVARGEETQQVKHMILEDLSGLEDGATGEVAINEVFDNQQVNPSGPYRDNGPDLIVGYNRGYRASWEGAVGKVTDAIIYDNTRSWSGDHCVDPRLVPGVLFSTRIDPQGAVFQWVTCVSYAMLAGLISRMIVMPLGLLAEVPLIDRLAAVAIAFLVFFGGRRRVLAGVAAGTVALVLLVVARANGWI